MIVCKKSYLFSLISLFFFALIGFSQDINTRVSLDIKSAAVKDVLDSISLQSGLNLTYNPSLFPLDSVISLQVNDTPVPMVLEKMFGYGRVTILKLEKQVILTLEKPLPSNKTKKYVINGFLRDSVSGNPLIGGVVYFENINKGVVTNPYGYYSISLPEGDYNIKFMFISFKNLEKRIYLNKDTTINIKMPLANVGLDTVYVHPYNKADIYLRNAIAENRIDMESFRGFRGIAGETDLIMYLQTLPGITNFGDGSTYYYASGGGKGQNLILVDEAPVYNPSHMFGISSVLIPEVVNEIKIYNGHLPSRYGERLSSIIDVYIKDGNKERFSGGLHLGPLKTTMLLNGPIKKDRSSFLLSFRKSTMQWAFQEQVRNGGVISFYDFNSKINTSFGKKNRLYLNFYGGNDRLTSGHDGKEHDGIAWGNVAGSLRWNHLLSNKMFFNQTLFASSYTFNYFFSIPDDIYWKSQIVNMGYKIDFTWYINPMQDLKYGIKVHQYQLSPGVFHQRDSILAENVPVIRNHNCIENAFYASHSFNVGDNLRFSYGTRVSGWSKYGPNYEYIYKNNDVVGEIYYGSGIYYNQWNIDPRLTANLVLNKRHAVKAGFTKATQYHYLVSNAISPLSSFDFWLPTGPNIPEQSSRFYALEYSGIYGENYDFVFKAQLYYRKMENQVYFLDHPMLLLNPNIENQLEFAPIEVRGYNVSVKRDMNRFKSSLSYSYTNAAYSGNRPQEGVPYIRPHNFSASLYLKLTNKLNLSTNFVFNSGQSISVPDGFYKHQGNVIPYFENMQDFRYPYHRMDLSISYQLNKPKSDYRHVLNLSVFNVYDRSNFYSVNYNKSYNSKAGYFVPQNVLNKNLYYPTGMYLFGIVPYLSYKIQF